ncbi:MAG: hypothetical protein JEY96_13385 [Bacteroidales bacterium]|jgi:hypothetical protein|nr:hypothetical protein [Bacteroidales bacterium]
MSKERVLIETMGYIKKEANLSTVENNIISNTLVLESLHPFPGYHGKNLPEQTSPRSLFLIVNKEYTYEEVARITKKVKQEFKHDFNASIGNIYFKTTSYSCIRIKYLKSFTFLSELQSLYQSEGVKFAKKKQIDSMGLIVIRKLFYVEEIEEGIYRDINESSKFYVDVPIDLTWDDFKGKIFHIRNNIDNSNFDAAQGVFYRYKGIVENVRLYICEGEFDKVKQIQKMYTELIQKQQ